MLHNDCYKPKESSGEKCHFQDVVWDFYNFDLCNFFLVPLGQDLMVESDSSRKVGLHKVPLVFLYNPPELRYLERSI